MSATKKSWTECVRHMTWAWWTIIMGTGVLITLSHNFPYGQNPNGGKPHIVLQLFFMFFFWLNLIFFIIIGGCTVARYVMFPDIWKKMLAHPAQSMFMGAFPMGSATLINGGLILNQEYHIGGMSFLYALWGFYWLDSLVSYSVAFGLLYKMVVRQDHSLAKMTGVWLLPVVTLIVASSSGGNIANSMRELHPTLSIVTAAFSFTMVIIGLSLALMMINIYLLRLIVHGPPDISLILSAFITLGPLGQGGYSLLASGEDLSRLLPTYIGTNFPHSELTGQIIFGVCFCGSYILWSMGICWIIVACFSIGNQVRQGRIPFSIAYWGMIFPNGVFAMLSVQLAKVLDSGFFRGFAALWCFVTFAIWVYAMILTVPAIIDRSIFKAPYLSDPVVGQVPNRPTLPTHVEKPKAPTPPHSAFLPTYAPPTAPPSSTRSHFPSYAPPTAPPSSTHSHFPSYAPPTSSAHSRFTSYGREHKVALPSRPTTTHSSDTMHSPLPTPALGPHFEGEVLR